MPKLKISSEKRKTSGTSGCEYTLVRLDGFIDAPNFLDFDQKLEKLVDGGADRLVLDFRRVQYINSTGITSLIRVHSNLTGRDGCLILVQVPRSVGLTMHLLGVTSFVPFLKGLGDAEKFLETKETTPPAEAEFYEAEAAKGEAPKEIPVLADAPTAPSGTVVVAVPREGPFTDILRNRLSGLNGRYQLTHSVDEIIKRLDEWDPDLVVLDHRLDGSDDFIANLKTNTHASLTSVIMLYQAGTDITRTGEFRVWENDFLIDPFDLMNLFRLTESELRRVPEDKKLFTQQVRFNFDSKRSGVERGLALCNQLLQKLKLSDTENTAIYAALKEAVDNAVLHGNHHDPEKKVEINFLVDPQKLTIMIEDEGEGFDFDYYLSKIDNQEAFEKAKQRIRAGGRGGLGILLMHKCSDRLDYAGHGNAVRIEKNLPAMKGGLSPDQRAALRKELLDLIRPCVRTGNITLSSGRTTDFYIDGRLVTLDPVGLDLIATLAVDALAGRCDAVGGPTSGADPIATAIGLKARECGLPLRMFFTRKEAKGHGMQRSVEGPPLMESDRVTIVDDVATTGGSLIRSAKTVREEARAQVDLALVVVDREEGARDVLSAEGIELISLFTRREIIGNEED